MKGTVPGGMPGIIGGIPCAGGIIPLIGIMLLNKHYGNGKLKLECKKNVSSIDLIHKKNYYSNSINAYPGGIPGMTGGIPGIIGGTPGIIGGIP